MQYLVFQSFEGYLQHEGAETIADIDGVFCLFNPEPMQLLGDVRDIWSAASGDIHYFMQIFIYGNLHIPGFAHNVIVYFDDC